MSNYTFYQLIDIPRVQGLLESNPALTGMAYGLFDADGNSLIAVGGQDICMGFHRANPVSCARCRESDAHIKAHLHDAGENGLEYRCKNGMIDVAMPIIIDGEHLATFFIGRFFYDDDLPDREYFRKQGEELGFDPEGYLQALDRVPVFSREYIRTTMLFLRNLVNVLAETGLGALKLAREIEARRWAEELMHRREQEFCALAENTPDTIARYDQECRLLYANRAFAGLAGVPVEALPGKTPVSYAALPGEVEYEAGIREVFQSGQAAEYEYTWPDRHGRLITSHIRMVPERNQHGRIVSVLCVGRDITERKSAEETIRRLNADLSSTLQAIPDMLFEMDRNGAYLNIWQQNPDLLARHKKILLGYTVVDLLAPDAAEIIMASIREADEKGCSYGKVIRIDLPGGEKWFELSVSKKAGTDLPGVRFIVLSRDITERKRMEDALHIQHCALEDEIAERQSAQENLQKQAQLLEEEIVERTKIEDALRESRNTLAEAQRIAHIGSWELDLGDNRLIWSDEIFRIFEIDQECFGASYEAFLDAVHPDDRDMVNTSYTESLNNRIPYEIEHRLLFPDGRIKYVHERCETWYAPDGTPLRSLGTVQDITGRKRMDKELQAKNSELERFTYTVSHDLKSPLITIKSFSGSIRSDLASNRNDRLEKDLDRICAAADKMDALLDDLLKLSRVGHVINTPEPVDMAKLVNDVLTNLAGTLKENSVQVSVQPGLPTVLCDRQRMMEVVQNLVENAVKYRGDQPEPRILIGLREERDRRVFFVRDNGPGIDPKFHENIFGLFNRLNTQVAGTGIGLALVKRIIEVHGGSIWVESDGCGTGSTFCFTVK